MTTPSRQGGYTTSKSTAEQFATALQPAQTQAMAGISPERSGAPTSPDRAMTKTLSLNLDLEPSKPSPPPATTLSRTGTLSWQQRPSSKGAGSRPNSLVLLDSRASPSLGTSPTREAGGKELSRADVARSLEGKDPSWFKQTADRGIGSAAYRKNQENDGISGNSVQLPGLADRAYEAANSPSRPKFGDKFLHNQISAENDISMRMSSPTHKGSPLPSGSAQRFVPPSDASISKDGSPTKSLAMSPAQRNISPERPISPTKGVGGFVQSAMLRRSDSLNKHKRAGSHAASSLSRTNSRASNPRDSVIDTSRETPITSARSSQDGNIQNLDMNPSTSPSRTMDTRRWSPTKQTWLGSAITKTDSPLSRSGGTLDTEMRFSDVSTSKESSHAGGLEKTFPNNAAGIDGDTGLSKGLSAPIYNPSKILSSEMYSQAEKSAGLADIGNENRPERSTEGLGIASKNTKKSSQAEDLALRAPDTRGGSTSSTSNAHSSKIPPIKSPKPDAFMTTLTMPELPKATANSQNTVSSRSAAFEQRAKFEPAVKKDFRAGLRSVNDSANKSKNEELEFKNVFGKLKKAETKNYVAPDELKNNIVRGKTGLNLTNGPRQYQKKDEFKDSILKKKEEMKAGTSAKAKSPELVSQSPIPEAIARQQKLAQKPVSEPVIDPPKHVPGIKPALISSKSVAEPSVATKLSASHPTIESWPVQQMGKVPDLKDSAKVIKEASLAPDLPKPPVPEKKTSAPAQLQSSAISSKLADRFNPALASVLARGPVPTTSQIVQPLRSTSPTKLQDENSQQRTRLSLTTAPLTHATKARAKGPKRRLPKNTEDVVEEDTQPQASVISPSQITIPRATEKSLRGSVREDHEQGIVNPKISTTTGVRSKPISSAALLSELKKSAQIPSKASSPTKNSSTPSITHIAEPKIATMTTETKRVPFAPGIAESSNNLQISPISPRSPPIPDSKANALSKISSSGQASDRLQVPVPGVTLLAFFDNLSSTKSDADFDTQALLTSDLIHEGKTRTIRKDVWEITGDGKRSPLSPQQEYIFFEDKMYLCRHHFEAINGKQSSQVYLWCGDGISPATVDDTQLFGGSEARNAGCKLQTLFQGKESIDFFEALGGIVITRRSNSATYMLCCRTHLTHIVFDEVDLSATSLCSGFAFIIATTGGDIYLWKGEGASADEVGCARLIGMDLGLTGEIEEVQEGHEPIALLEALKVDRIDPSPKFWIQKASASRYTNRLFIVDADSRPRSTASLSNFAANMWKRRPSTPSNTEINDGTIREISPYSQSDISEDKIFVLDAFFETFVIVGSQTRSKSSSFIMALNFAQEYGILSVSMQDRPSIPKSHVLFLGAAGDVPRGVQIAFRKWDVRVQRQQSSWAPENVLMPLNEALRALESLENSS